MKIAKVFEISTGHRLSNYDGNCKHFHGHNYIGEIIISSEQLNSLGMVADFKDIKKLIKDEIESLFDHKFVMKKGDELNEATRKLWESYNDHSAVMVDYNPTVENLIKHMQTIVQTNFYRGKIHIRLKETSNSYAEI